MIPQNLAPLRKKSSDLGNCIQILFMYNCFESQKNLFQINVHFG